MKPCTFPHCSCEQKCPDSPQKLRVLDLFSGIGGFSLGLERTGGFETVAFCEIEPFCRKVLAKHWPDVKQYEDVRTLTADTLSRDGIAVDVICGGFPCQDISLAGKQAGLDGERSGLWSEIVRLARELRPQFVIVENVAALLGNGLGRVLGDLAEIRFDAEWHCIPASAVGAHHRRDRIWIVAHPMRVRHDRQGATQVAAHHQERNIAPSERGGRSVASQTVAGCEDVADADSQRELQSQGRLGNIGRWIGDCGWWVTEPDVGRVAHGVPQRVDRLKAIGNAVVPQIPELIGNAILESRRAA